MLITANDVIIIDEEDDQKDTKVTDMKKEYQQKPAQWQKQEASKKTEEQVATPVQEQGEGRPPQAVKHKEKPTLSQRYSFFQFLW